jgi:hypothetical protein
MAEYTYNPQDFAGIMRVIFALILETVPDDVPGPEAFKQVQPQVVRLRKRVQRAYDKQTKAPIVEIYRIADTVLHMIENHQSVDSICAMTNGKLVKKARSAR